MSDDYNLVVRLAKNFRSKFKAQSRINTRLSGHNEVLNQQSTSFAIYLKRILERYPEVAQDFQSQLFIQNNILHYVPIDSNNLPSIEELSSDEDLEATETDEDIIERWLFIDGDLVEMEDTF